MEKYEFISLFIFAIFLIPLVHANGLSIDNPNIIINKTVSIDEPIILQITNEEPFDFFNITLENSEFVSMDIINKIPSGQTVSVNATVFANQDLSQNFKLKGFFFTEVGQQNEIHEVVITPHDVDICDFNGVKGDTVKWVNTINDEIVIKKAGSGEPVETIQSNSTFQKQFLEPEIFNYFLSRQGFRFPAQDCAISILDDNGLVNDPNLDATFSLTVNVDFQPTTISVNIPLTDYNMRFFDTQEGVLSITNTGNEIARNVRLNEDWFEFSSNEFDIPPGQTKGITYKINPIISETNDTNKTNIRTLSITGNFDTFQKNFSIFIEYSEISENATTTLQEAKGLLEAVCGAFPDIDVCQEKVRVVFRSQNESDVASFNITEDQYNKIWLSIFDEQENRKILFNFVKESLADIKDQVLVNSNKTDVTESAILQLLEENREQSSTFWTVFTISILMISISIAGFIVAHYRRKKIMGAEKNWDQIKTRIV